MNDHIERRVRVHDALRPKMRPAGLDVPHVIEPAHPRVFTIQQCWARGRFEASLFAPSDDRSFTWRETYIRDAFPGLPADRQGRLSDLGDFWPRVARYNGGPQTALQKNWGRDANTLNRCLDLAVQHDILFRLAQWTRPDEERVPPDLIYWTDSGLLHQMLDERTPETMKDPARGKSYEGFAIGALVDAAGPGARPRVWRRGSDEIDLILDWDGTDERWAIEISYSTYKKLGDGFERGCDETEPTRRMVIQRDAGSRINAKGVERMTLGEALHETLSRWPRSMLGLAAAISPARLSSISSIVPATT